MSFLVFKENIYRFLSKYIVLKILTKFVGLFETLNFICYRNNLFIQEHFERTQNL